MSLTVPHRHPQQPRDLVGHAGLLAVHAALAEQLLRMGLLEIAPADLLPRDVRRDRQHRHPAPVRVEQAVDQVAPQSAAKDASVRSRPGLSPAAMSRAAAVSGPAP